ncbi:MAG: hypothetical protein JJ900_15820 [Rhodospirillales bacterium]|nr:hypothetical protein [Rhodospirillales bacterium]MBO6788316.1 hypothetical protein [Rhodospirillales bacterium]
MEMHEINTILTSDAAEIVTSLIAVIGTALAGYGVLIARRARKAMDSLRAAKTWIYPEEESPSAENMASTQAQHYGALADANLALLSPQARTAFNRFIVSELAVRGHIEGTLNDVRNLDEDSMMEFLNLQAASEEQKSGWKQLIPFINKIEGIEKLAEKIFSAANDYIKGVAKNTIGRGGPADDGSDADEEWADQSP